MTRTKLAFSIGAAQVPRPEQNMWSQVNVSITKAIVECPNIIEILKKPILYIFSMLSVLLTFSHSWQMFILVVIFFSFTAVYCSEN
jgi:hypothetical protein